MGEPTKLPCLLSPEASEDLLAIWMYLADHASPAIADKQVWEIERACYFLGAWTEYGRPRDDVRVGLHSISVSRYVVFYRITRSAIEIVRVVDERRDVDTVFLTDR